MEAKVQVDGDDDRGCRDFGGFHGILNIVSSRCSSVEGFPLTLPIRSAATGSIRGSFPNYHIDAYVMGT
jgi:hypothetical protein